MKNDNKSEGEVRKLSPDRKRGRKEVYKKGHTPTTNSKKNMDHALGEHKEESKKKSEEERLEKNHTENLNNKQANSKNSGCAGEKFEKSKEQKCSSKKNHVKTENDHESAFVNVDDSDGESDVLPANKSLPTQPKLHQSPKNVSNRRGAKIEHVKTPNPSPDVQIIDVKQPSHISADRHLSSPSSHQYNDPNAYSNPAYPPTSMHSLSSTTNSSYHHSSNSQPPSYPSHQPLPRSGKPERKHLQSSSSTGYSRSQHGIPPHGNIYENCDGCYPYPLGDSGQPQSSGNYPGADAPDRSGMHKQGCQSYGLQRPPMDYTSATGSDISYPHHAAYSSAAYAAAAMYPPYGMYMHQYHKCMEEIFRNAVSLKIQV